MGGLRYFGGALAFGFAAVWIMASLLAALVCLASAAVGFGVLFVAERRLAERATRTSSPEISATRVLAPPRRPAEVEDLPLWASALNSDLGHIYEPSATNSPISADLEYGWPLDDDTVIADEQFH